MRSFPLTIVTPDGLCYEGEANQLTVRTVTGELGVLAGHADCVAPLAMGRAAVYTPQGKRFGACIGGLLSVTGGKVRVLATTFEWADDIDLDRAKRSEDRARTALADRSTSDADLRLAEARLKRALIRQNVASYK